MAISYKELFDFDGLDSAFKDLEQSEEHFAKAVIDDLKRIQRQSAVTKSELTKMVEALKNINVTNDGGKNRLSQLAADADAATKAFIEQNNAMNGNKVITAAVKDEIARLKAEYQALKNAQEENKNKTAEYRAEIERLKAAQQALRNELAAAKLSQQQYDQQIAKSKQTQQQLREEILKAKLEDQKAAAEKKKLAVEAAKLAAATKLAGSSIKVAAGSYNEAQKRLTELGKSIKNAEGGFKSQTPAIKAQIAEYNKLNDALKKFDAQLGNHQRNVGNYKGALSGVLGELTGLASSYLSAGAALQYVFNQTLAFERLKTPLTFILGSEGDANNKLAELKKLANALGLEYFTLAGAYKSFTAAARASNFDLAKSEAIFMSVTKASAVLGLSSEQLEGALLAIQQMMSKGNVQAEELRGQLAERLPGAFALAAKAMNVTEKELNGLLKTGSVTANDLLPKLAKELDKAYGDKAKDGIHGLNAELNSFYSALQSFAGESSWLSNNIFQPIIRGAKETLLELTQLTRGSVMENLKYLLTFDSASLKVQRQVYDLRDANKNNQSALDGSAKIDYSTKNLQELRNYYQQQDANFKNAVRSYEEFRKGIKDGSLKEEFTGQLESVKNIATGLLFERKRIGAEIDRLKKREISTTKELTDAELTSIAAIRKRISDLSKLDGSAIQGSEINNRIDALKKRLKELTESSKTAKKHVKDLIEVLDEEKKALERSLQIEALRTGKRGELFKPSDETLERLDAVNDKLKAAKDLIDYLNFRSNGLVLSDSALKAGDALKTTDPKQAQVTTKTGGFPDAKKAEKLIEDQKNIELEVINLVEKSFTNVASVIGDHWSDMFYSMTDSLRSFVNEGKVSFEDFANIAGGLASGVAGSFKQASEARISTLEAEKEREVNAAGDNANARAAIEANYNKKINAEKRKQAKIDKEMALLSIAMNTAAAVMSVLRTGGGTYFADFGISASLLSSFVIGMGAIQAALVLAKPLPQFWTGTENAPEGHAEIAERGPELLINPDGTKELATKRQIKYLKKGTIVKNAPDTARILSGSSLAVNSEGRLISTGSELSNSLDKMNLYNYLNAHHQSEPFDYDRLIKGFGNEIKKMPFDQHIWDDKGYGKFKIDQNTRIKDLNARNSWG